MDLTLRQHRGPPRSVPHPAKLDYFPEWDQWMVSTAAMTMAVVGCRLGSSDRASVCHEGPPGLPTARVPLLVLVMAVGGEGCQNESRVLWVGRSCPKQEMLRSDDVDEDKG